MKLFFIKDSNNVTLRTISVKDSVLEPMHSVLSTDNSQTQSRQGHINCICIIVVEVKPLYMNPNSKINDIDHSLC